MDKLRTTDAVAFPDKDTIRVMQIFNEMADEYDDIRDCWYQHLFESLDRIILENFPNLPGNSSVLDVGCGTGRQSFLFARLGARVVGIDIAEELLKVGRSKASAWPGRVEFMPGDATGIPFAGETFDVVNCCGSTLSFIPDYQKALAEMARVLKPGGRIITDVEQKWNLDIFWVLLSGLFFDFVHYGTTLREAVGYLRLPPRQGYQVDYPFQKLSGETVPMQIRLFTTHELDSALRQVGVVTAKRYGIHVITNLVPSTVLHNPRAGRLVRAVFRILSQLETNIQGRSPFSGLGNTLVVLGSKTNP